MSIRFDGCSSPTYSFTLEDSEEFFDRNPFFRTVSPFADPPPAPHEDSSSAPVNPKKRQRESHKAASQPLQPLNNLGKIAFIYFSAIDDLSPRSSKSDKYTYTYKALEKAYPGSYPTKKKLYYCLHHFFDVRKSKGSAESYDKYVSSKELTKIKALCSKVISEASVARPDNLEQTAFVYFSVVNHLSPESSEAKKSMYAYKAFDRVYPGIFTEPTSFSARRYSFIKRKTAKGTLETYDKYISAEELAKIEALCLEIIPKNGAACPKKREETAFIYFSVIDHLSPASSRSEKLTYTYESLEKAYPEFYKRKSIPQQIFTFTKRRKKHNIQTPYTEYVSSEELAKIETLCREVIPKTPLTISARCPDNKRKTAFVYFSAIDHLSPESSKSEKYTYTYHALNKAYPSIYPEKRYIASSIEQFIRIQKTNGTLESYDKCVATEELAAIEKICREIIYSAST